MTYRVQSRFSRRALSGLWITLFYLQQGAYPLPEELIPAAWATERLTAGDTRSAKSPSLVANGRVTKKSGYTLGTDRCGEAPLTFPKLPIGMRPGYCAGIVASKDDGLIAPRSIVQVPDARLFVVADLGVWPNAGQGRLLLLDPEAPEGRRVKVLLTGLDLPHGLAVGIDRRIYASTAEKVFRFNAFAAEPETTIEVILQNLPAIEASLLDGSRIYNLHPLKQFVFDKTGRIYVNIGAPTDNCVKDAPESKPCEAGEGGTPFASIWAFTPPASGVFPALKPSDANPPHEIYAHGLRNSIALALHPQFPAKGFAFLQAENARDLPDLMSPNEELNTLERGSHYGWPYCYDLVTQSPEYKAFLQTKTPYQDFCTSNSSYKKPYSLLPPHSAPLSMLYYQGEKFPELWGKLLVGLHGYRPTGSRVIFYDVDAKGFPKVSAPPVTYHVSCAAAPTRVFQTEQEPQVPAAPFDELIFDWHKVNGVRPRGAPVGMTVASDGAIWLVEDKNQSIMRIDAEPVTTPTILLRCETRTEQQIEELLGFIAKNRRNQNRLSQIRTQLVERHCMGCHSNFDLEAGMDDAQKDATVLRFILRQDGWVYPGDPEAGRLHSRVRGMGGESIMPPNGQELIAKDAIYRQLLDTLDRMVIEMVPGKRMRINRARLPAVPLHNRDNKICGEIPNDTLVMVVNKRPKERPGSSRIFRPADRYLNGDCADRDGYYIGKVYLGAL